MSGRRAGLSLRWDCAAGYRMFSRWGGPEDEALPPVVFVHGLSMSSLYFVRLAKKLSADYPVRAPDLPGYGRSEKPEQALDVETLAGVLSTWLDVVGIGPAYFIANSMGCQITASLAAREPERVLRAVLIGPSMDPRVTGPLRLLMHGAENMLFEPSSFYPVLLRDYFAAGVRETLQAIRFAIQHPMREVLPHVQAPVLVVRGTRDALVTEPWAEEVTRLLPHGRLALVRGAAHVANFNSPAACAWLARWFFRA